MQLCSNIELRNFDIQNRALKISCDTENLICGYFLDAREGF